MKHLYENKRIRLTADELNFYVEELGTTGKDAKVPGIERILDTKYYSTLEGALKQICKGEALADCEDLSSYIRILQETWQEIRATIGEAGKA